MQNTNPDKVLVCAATGRVGGGVTKALKEAGFDVYGTTRNEAGKNKLEKNGVKGVICDYTDKAQVQEALKSTGCKLAFILTDFIGAAKKNIEVEVKHGKEQIEACKAAGCQFVIFNSVHCAELVPEDVHHFKSKLPIEKYLLESGLNCAILRPGAFFENLDDPSWNPLKKGVVRFPTACSIKWTATYDIGRAAAAIFKDQSKWNRKVVDIVCWEGKLNDVAAALTNVSGTPTKPKIALPMFFRWLFLGDLHRMFNYYEAGYPGYADDRKDFHSLVSVPTSAEDWFKAHGTYANGEKIVP